MYFIENGENLIGKTIAFIHSAQFAEAITIATTDGGIMVIRQLADDDESEIEVYHELRAEAYIFRRDDQKWLVNELVKRRVITSDDYEKRIEERRKAQEEYSRKEKKRREEYERKEYLRLKAKFEGAVSCDHA